MSTIKIIARIVKAQSEAHAEQILLIRAGKTNTTEYARQEGYYQGLSEAMKIAAEVYDEEIRGD